jgi:hypothetical protein
MFLDVQKCYMNLKKVAMLWQTSAMSGNVRQSMNLKQSYDKVIQEKKI